MAAIWTRKSSRRVILNVFRNPRKRIGYCIALVPSTNCSIITISRCTPDTQRWRSAGAMEDRSCGMGVNAGSKLKFNSSGARNLSEGAATRHCAGIAGYNCGEGRFGRSTTRYSRGYRMSCSSLRPRCGGWIYATIEHRDEGHTIWWTTLPQHYWRRSLAGLLDCHRCNSVQSSAIYIWQILLNSQCYFKSIFI